MRELHSKPFGTVRQLATAVAGSRRDDNLQQHWGPVDGNDGPDGCARDITDRRFLFRRPTIQ